jgi:hypothetical protein
MKLKITISVILLLILSLNIYFTLRFPDIYTQSKIQLSSLVGSTSYLGRLNFWKLLVQNNDWNHAATLEPQINQNQVKDYKLSYQPQELQSKLLQLENNTTPTADDFIEIARIQSILGLSTQAVESIKKAHQLDPIRSDIDRLFYQTN